MSASLDQVFRDLVQPLHLPQGETESSLYDYLAAFSLEGASTTEMQAYLREDFRRFLYTIALLPDAASSGPLLEIGANPYFTSLLLRRFTRHRLHFTNFFGVHAKSGSQTLRHAITGEVVTFEYRNSNIEVEDIPFGEPFQVILFCEVIEHLQNDPMQALLRIKRALAPGGTLVLSTPNVSRLENVARMICGANLYDPYSGYGPYGRHNREYNKHELHLLLAHCGFEIETMFSSDVHENHSESYYRVTELAGVLNKLQDRRLDLGQYIFLRARNVRQAKPGRPAWLYRSYPSSELSAG